MPARKFDAGSLYRYGFNAQERLIEIDPGGNNNTAEFWQYDARLARRWNIDPKLTTGLSSYSTFGNNPIWMTDPQGDTSIEGQLCEPQVAEKATMLSEVVVKSRLNYSPESDLMYNRLTKYNSETGKSFTLNAKATVKSLATEFIQNWQCDNGSCRNTLIVGGPLLEEVRKMHSVRQLFISGVNNLKQQGYAPGSTFMGRYRMSNLVGKDVQKMVGQVTEDIADGESFFDSRFFSAEFFLGSYGFSMRITNDGKNIAIAVYDSKTISSLTDGNNRALSAASPINPNTLPTYQRYFWVVPIEKLEEEYTKTVIE